MAPTDDYHVSKAAAARFFGVSTQALDGWFRRGAPVAERDDAGRIRTLDLSELARWRIGQAADGELERERVRLTKAQADKTELEAARLSGELVPAEELTRQLADVISAHRAKLLQMPQRVPEFLAADSVVEAEQGLRDMVYEALQEFADLLAGRAADYRAE